MSVMSGRARRRGRVKYQARDDKIGMETSMQTGEETIKSDFLKRTRLCHERRTEEGMRRKWWGRRNKTAACWSQREASVESPRKAIDKIRMDRHDGDLQRCSL